MESIVLRPARSSKDLQLGLKTSKEGFTQAITQEKKGFSLAGFVKERSRVFFVGKSMGLNERARVAARVSHKLEFKTSDSNPID